MVSSAKDRDVTIASPKEATGASKGQSEGGGGQGGSMEEVRGKQLP